LCRDNGPLRAVTAGEAAVLLSAADLAEPEETLSVLSDPQALADIREADAAYAQGDVIRGVDAVRALRS
jgi:antitoxin YefM